MPKAHAAFTGDPNCPAAQTCLSIIPSTSTFSPGQLVNLAIAITNAPTFAGWDIAVKVDTHVLNPNPYNTNGIILDETFGNTASTFTKCTNGVGQGCAAVDGAGVSHSAVTSLGASDAGSVFLFNVTYTAVAAGTTSVAFTNSVTTSVVSDPSGASVVDCLATPQFCLDGTVTVQSALTLISVIRGTDNNNLYYNIFGGSWGGWNFLGGSSPSRPTLCASGAGNAEVIVRGLDNGIYHKTFTGGVPAASWDTPGGATSDQPACAVLGTTMHVVVRGTDNRLYYTTYDLTAKAWRASSWSLLNVPAAAASAPTLVGTSTTRLDLVIRGLDNGIYHSAFVSGSWTASDTPGPVLHSATSDVIAAVSDGTSLHVVVRGLDNGLYYDSLTESTNTWATASWTYLGGTTNVAPSLAIESAGVVDLVVKGTDNHIYHKSLSGGVWAANWDSPGGSTPGSPAISATGTTLNLIVQGTDSGLWFNTLASGLWTGWISVGGATIAAPSLVSV